MLLLFMTVVVREEARGQEEAKLTQNELVLVLFSPHFSEPSPAAYKQNTDRFLSFREC